MIVGIGTDLCQVERMEKSLERPSFVQLVFSTAEQQLLGDRRGKAKAQTAAANFAAKEAFLKAAGVGLGGFAMADIAVLRKESGAPYYVFSGTAQDWMQENHLTALLSLTHEGGLACAFAVLQKNKTDA